MDEKDLKASGHQELRLSDYWTIIWGQKKLILTAVGVCVITAMTVSLLLPKIYESEATILSPEEEGTSGLGALLTVSQMASAIPGLSIPSMSTNKDLFVSILKSRTMAQDVVDKFKLEDRYEANYVSDAIRKLGKRTDITVSKEGVISIEVEDTNPQMAADLANFYVANLDALLRRFGTADAGKQKDFVAKQLAKTQKELQQAEEALRDFKERYSAMALEVQAKASVEAAGTLKGQIVAKEVELEALRNFASEENPEVQVLKRQIEEMNRQLALMYDRIVVPSESPSPGESRKEIHVPFSELPELGLQLARLTREVKVQETVYILLTKQLEETKIAEAKDIPTVRVLDKAVPADRKSRPKVLLNMVLAGVLSLFLGVTLALLVEHKPGGAPG